MEQHGNELDDNDGEEEEHENNSNRLKVQVLFGDNDLGNSELFEEVILVELRPIIYACGSSLLFHCVIPAVDLWVVKRLSLRMSCIQRPSMSLYYP